MEDQEIIDQLKKVFTKVFKRNITDIAFSTTAKDITGWDSLTHIMLIDEIEKQFKISFKLKEVMNFKNVGDTINCIKTKVNR